MKKTVLAMMLTLALLFSALFIYHAQAEGWSTIQVSTPGLFPRGASITSDGSMIAFKAMVDDRSQVFVIDWDGTGLKQCTDGVKTHSAPSVSGDGKKVACYSYIETKIGELSLTSDMRLVVLNSDGAGLTTFASDSPLVSYLTPSISYDGSKVAFVVYDNSTWEERDLALYVVNSDGTGLAKLASNLTLPNYPSSRGACISGDGAKITFSAVTDDGDWIFVINSDGSGLTRLAPNISPTSNYRYPSISDNGSKVTFSSYSGGNYEIFVVNSDGSELRQLTQNVADDDNPVISGDGSKIAFDSSVDGLFIVNSDGTGLKQVAGREVHAPSISFDGNRIATIGADFRLHVSLNLNSEIDGNICSAGRWSTPIRIASNVTSVLSMSISGDGDKIAFVSEQNGNHELFVVNSDGTGRRQLTNGVARWISELAFSKDDRKIAFTSSSNTSDCGVFLINSDGTGLTRLFSSTFPAFYPSISSDGTKIAFTCGLNANYDYGIFVVDSNGTLLARITDYADSFSNLVLTSDGTRILFTSLEGTFMVNSDGTELKKLEFGLHVDSNWLSMSADGGRIAFLADHHGEPEVYVATSDGTILASPTINLPQVIHILNPPSLVDLYTIASPCMSGDGGRIVFVCGNVFAVDSEGTEIDQVSNFAGVYEKPLISNDGNKVAFLSQTGADSEVTRATFDVYVSYDPSSPAKTPVPIESPRESATLTDSFSATLAFGSAIAVVVVGLSLLVYLKKRHGDKIR